MSGKRWIRKKAETLWGAAGFAGAAAIVSAVFLFSGKIWGFLEEKEERMPVQTGATAAAIEPAGFWKEKIPEETAQESVQRKAKESTPVVWEQSWEKDASESLGLEAERVKAENGKTQEEAAASKELAPRIALTFDDGPHPFYTEQILDGLKERGVKATFFVLGRNLSGNEAVIKRMDEEGHLIGNHTYNHSKLDELSREQAVKEIEKTSSLVEKITGHGTEYVRPPFGIWDKRLEYEVSMIPVLWNIDPLDWTTKNVPGIVDKVMKTAKDQGIILFHDYYASSVKAALQTVDLLQKQGYEFVTVNELILE